MVPWHGAYHAPTRRRPLDRPGDHGHTAAMSIARAALWLLALAVAACSAPARDDVVWGTLDATVYGALDAIEAVALEPAPGAARRPEIEARLARSLGWRGIAVQDEAPLLLRYVIESTPVATEGDGLGIMLAGSGGSSGDNDLGLGFDLPLFGDRGKQRQTAFLLELRLAERDGTLLWRGRARGRARLTGEPAIARAVAPLLLGQLGRTEPGKAFSR